MQSVVLFLLLICGLFFFVLQLRSPSSSHDDVNLGPSANPQSVTFRSFYVVQRGIHFDAQLNVLSVFWIRYFETILCFKSVKIPQTASLQIDIAYNFLNFMHQNTDSLKEEFTPNENSVIIYSPSF